MCQFTNVTELADAIIGGFRITREMDTSLLLQTNLSTLGREANRIRKAFFPEHIDLCTIISGRCGKCSDRCNQKSAAENCTVNRVISMIQAAVPLSAEGSASSNIIILRSQITNGENNTAIRTGAS